MSEIFFDAITSIREELVEEAQEFVFRRRHTWRQRYAGMAACLVLAGTLLFGVYQLSQLRMGGSGAGNNTAAPSAGSGLTGSSGGGMLQDPGAVSGDQAEHGSSGMDGADTNQSGDGQPSSVEPVSQMSFPAVVLEVRTDALVVEVLSDNDMGVQQAEVPTGGLEDLPEFRPGDVVTVYCAGLSGGDGAAAAVDVAAILLTEPPPDNP